MRRSWKSILDTKDGERTRRRILLASIAGISIVIVLILVVLLSFRQSISLANRLDAQGERELVANYLAREGRQSIARQKVQLTWDDAFKAAAYGPPDAQWSDTYLGSFLWTNFHYDRLYLVDPQGRLLRSWSDGVPVADGGFAELNTGVSSALEALDSNAEVFGVPASLRQLSDTRWPFDADGRALTRWTQYLVALDGRPGMLTIASLVPDTDMGLLRGTPNHLVAVRFFDSDFLAELSGTLLLEKVEAFAAEPSRSANNGLPLVNAHGRTIAWLGWHSDPRGLVIAGRMRPLFTTMLCAFLALMIGGYTMIRALSRTLVALGASEAQAVERAQTDEMTRLASRGHFSDRLAAALVECAPGGQDTLVIAFIDIDNFKLVNDSLGHPVGDELVRQVAQRLRSRLPASDLLARMGGDEFVLMRRCKTAQGNVSKLGRELMALFARPFKIDGHVLDVTTSCGISWSPDHGTSAEELLRKADIAMFHAKQRGRGRWRAFTQEMASHVSRRLELEIELRKAIRLDALHLAYQPIVDAGTGRIVGAEALLRWDHPELGPISPGIFVPVAEQAGLMPQLGWWVLARVFEQQRAWPDLNISVNLSPLQLAARDFADDLAVLVRDYRADPRRITLEVTEGLLLDRGKGAFDVLGVLRAMGFALALDDFGTGYSSLSYLRAFRFDRLKIDRAFVQNIENDLDAQSILKAIVTLAKGLDADTVAEGVESLLQRELVVAAGCDKIQGFHYHAPLEPGQMTALLNSDRRPDQAPQRLAS